MAVESILVSRGRAAMDVVQRLAEGLTDVSAGTREDADRLLALITLNPKLSRTLAEVAAASATWFAQVRVLNPLTRAADDLIAAVRQCESKLPTAWHDWWNCRGDYAVVGGGSTDAPPLQKQRAATWAAQPELKPVLLETRFDMTGCELAQRITRQPRRRDEVPTWLYEAAPTWQPASIEDLIVLASLGLLPERCLCPKVMPDRLFEGPSGGSLVFWNGSACEVWRDSGQVTAGTLVLALSK